MTPLNLRIDRELEDKAKIAGQSFMRAFVRRRFSDAARHAHVRLMWFGDELSRERWLERAAAALGSTRMEQEWAGEIAPSLLSQIDGAILGGPIEEQDRIHLFHVTRDGSDASIGLVIRAESGGDPCVLRVFDPRPLCSVLA